MYAGAISFARLRRLYHGAVNPKGGAVASGVRLFAQAWARPMSQLGQSRRSDPPPITSRSFLLADIRNVRWDVSNVPPGSDIGLTAPNGRSGPDVRSR
jgi:hypothetical protein